MLSGLNLLKLFLTSLSTSKGRKMSLPMLYLDVIPCSLNLITNFFGLESIKEMYATDVDFKDAYENCREGRTWNKYVL
jgi:hypothetical protein